MKAGQFYSSCRAIVGPGKRCLPGLNTCSRKATHGHYCWQHQPEKKVDWKSRAKKSEGAIERMMEEIRDVGDDHYYSVGFIREVLAGDD